jgi:hypothetical protein
MIGYCDISPHSSTQLIVTMLVSVSSHPTRGGYLAAAPPIGRSGRRIGRGRGRGPNRTFGRGTSCRTVTYARPPQSLSCRVAGASRSTGRLGLFWSSRGRRLRRPTSTAGLHHLLDELEHVTAVDVPAEMVLRGVLPDQCVRRRAGAATGPRARTPRNAPRRVEWCRLHRRRGSAG